MSLRPAARPRLVQKPKLSDSELAAAVRRGDSSVTDHLYDRLRPAIEYAMLRILRRRDSDLDDLVQATFERVIRSLTEDRFSGQGALTTWASAIATHVAIDFLRRSRVERRLFSEAPPAEALVTTSDVYSAERNIEARSEIQRLHVVLSQLKPKSAETLVLHDVFGHSVEEVAVLIGASVPAVRSRLFRARREFVRRAGGKPT